MPDRSFISRILPASWKEMSTVTCDAIALRTTGNYHLSIVVVSVMSLIGLAATLFLKSPSFVSVRKPVTDMCRKMKGSYPKGRG